jgi:hypothetical protein
MAWYLVKAQGNFTFTFIPEGKRPLGEPRRGWEDNIRMDIRQAVWEVVVWFKIASICVLL